MARTEPCEGIGMKPHRIIRNPTRNVGEPSSKYGYDRDGSQFEADLRKHFEEGEALYQDFVDWMKSKCVDPRKFRNIFMRYHEEFME